MSELDMVEKIAEKHAKYVEQITVEQFEQCLIEAIKSGDFMRHVQNAHFHIDKTGNLKNDSRYSMTYVPYREKQSQIIFIQELKQQLKDANEMIENLKGGAVIDQDTSDGYHTFRELYNHRRILTKSLFNIAKDDCWKSKLHDDGTMFDNYFIVGLNTHEGSATYHYHLDYWNDFNCEALEKAPSWDGHTSDDAIKRIDDYFNNKKRNI